MSQTPPGRPVQSTSGASYRIDPIDGVLVIDKPAGPTSHDVVARVRRICRSTKVGHTGTLDPTATGVLPLVLGRATRLARFLAATDKTYEAAIHLGQATSTFDIEGDPVGPAWGGFGEADGRLRIGDRTAVDTALATLTGTYQQAPPPYSAKKIEGVRAYELARAGRPVQPSSVTVTVRRLELLAIEGDFVQIEVTATAGFYVRVLADQLGRGLGVGGHLHALRRTRSGAFDLSSAVPLAELERDPEVARAAVIPLDRLLLDHPAVMLTAAGAERARHGRDVGPADVITEAESVAGPVRLLDEDSRLIAVGEPADRPRFLHPVVVLG